MKPTYKTLGFLFCALLILNGCTPEIGTDKDFLLLTNIDNRLQNSNTQMVKQNRIITKRIIALRKQDSTDQILIHAQTTRARSQEAVDFINGLRITLISKTGGYLDDDPAKRYTGILNKETITEIMIGEPGANDGMGYFLKQKINGCISDFNKIKKHYPGNNSSPYNYLALDAKDDLTCTISKYKRDDFATYNFKDAPLIIALSELSQLENELLKYETALLNELFKEALKK